MQLTADLVINAPTYTNAINERTVSFRSNGLLSLQNLESLADVYECIDFTNNELAYLGNFPSNKTLFNATTLLFANNKISEIEDSIGDYFPNVTKISLIMNDIESYQELYKLRELKNLKSLAIHKNPITAHSVGYRSFLISILPSLEVIDFERVKNAERERAKELDIEKILLDDKKKRENSSSGKRSVRVNRENLSHQNHSNDKNNRHQRNVVNKLNDSDRQLLKKQLLEAESLEEIQQIETRLKQGYW
ncbi:U2 snRNP complex subunit [Saccharomycopsis crataegensis]|uniref:U2 small nuclear ribonucleoprotein A' n=1 Tax=Saccharomycopsis crataegensis TaxID=43959 RepID=A0AAV5QQ25_9ASCO|nr:U2 snRNP complex subunit [Saccharomycopsis crataegensis]